MRFIPLAELEAAGYGAWRARVEDRAKPAPELAAEGDQAMAKRTGPTETAILAGGCFWGMEEILRKIPGVLETQVGYTGGSTTAPSYDDVRRGTTGHAESVRIVFDPTKLAYADLLEKWFFRMHDPTTRDRQGNDVGTQYRSAIFPTTPEQKATARAVIDKVEASGLWDDPIVTEIIDAGEWTDAEGYHQDYLQKHPNGYTCHYLR
jgi:peptide methionine sulfoxide reductase msrA/msrB